MEDLIIYSSTDGQTKKICETIKAHISSNNNFKIISLNVFTKKENEIEQDWFGLEELTQALDMKK